MKKRVFLVVAECLGIGDPSRRTAEENDGAGTLLKIYKTGKLNVPFLRALGLFNIDGLGFGRRSCIVSGAFGKCLPSSAGFDTQDGYAELMGRISGGPSTLRSVTAADLITGAGMNLIGIGRAADLFECERVCDTSSDSNMQECINAFVSAIRMNFDGLCIVSIPTPEFSDPAHRTAADTAASLAYADKRLAKITNLLYPSDILILTAVHGLDPGVGFTKESVPVLVYGGPIRGACHISQRKTFADVSATILDYLDIKNTLDGESFLPLILRG